MKTKTRTTIVVTVLSVATFMWFVALIIAMGRPLHPESTSLRPDAVHGLVCPMPTGRIFTSYGTVTRCTWYWAFAAPLYLLVFGGLAGAFVMYGIFKFRRWRGRART